jgi:hypothetical protein
VLEKLSEDRRSSEEVQLGTNVWNMLKSFEQYEKVQKLSSDALEVFVSIVVEYLA